MTLKYGPEIYPSNITEETIYDRKKLLSEFNNAKKKCILTGQVQAGKTKEILNIINDAFKYYHFNSVILLGGTNNELLSQTLSRCKNFFKDNDINIKDISHLNLSAIDKTIYVVLKEQTNLKKIYDFYKDKKEQLKKILIIDDEADYGSINTCSTDSPSTINKFINKIYNEIKSGGLLSITATPYANILNIKDNNHMLIDNIYCLPTNDDYTGINFFNNIKDFYVIKDNYSSNYYDDIIRFSIIFWILKSYAFFEINKSNSKYSDLLIYISDLTDDHKKFYKSVQTYLNDIKCWNEYYKQKFIDIINEHFYWDNANKDNFFIWLKNNTGNIKCFINNIDTEFNYYDNKDIKMKIIIGGNCFSRGITYENILTELFLYVSEKNVNVDTLLQRCRWFGYRKKDNRYKYMNVITNARIKELLLKSEEYNDIFFSNKNGTINTFDYFKNKVNKIDNRNEVLKGTDNAKK